MASGGSDPQTPAQGGGELRLGVVACDTLSPRLCPQAAAAAGPSQAGRGPLERACLLSKVQGWACLLTVGDTKATSSFVGSSRYHMAPD